MRYLVDSDWIADYPKGRTEAGSLLSQLILEGAGISIVTYAEIYEGVYYGNETERHEASFRALLRVVPVIPVTRRVARRYARLADRLRREGRIIDQPDLLIAATAIERDLILVTRNTRDFGRIEELHVAPSATS